MRKLIVTVPKSMRHHFLKDTIIHVEFVADGSSNTDGRNLDRFNFFSTRQINEYFALTVQAIQEQSAMFKRVRDNDYYIFLPEGGSTTFTPVVVGTYIRSFEVHVPSVEELKEKSIRIADPMTSPRVISEHVERLFDKYIACAYDEMMFYQYQLQHLHEVSSIAEETLYNCLVSIQRQLYRFQHKIQYAISGGILPEFSETIESLQKIERFLVRQLRVRKCGNF